MPCVCRGKWPRSERTSLKGSETHKPQAERKARGDQSPIGWSVTSLKHIFHMLTEPPSGFARITVRPSRVLAKMPQHSKNLEIENSGEARHWKYYKNSRRKLWSGVAGRKQNTKTVVRAEKTSPHFQTTAVNKKTHPRVKPRKNDGSADVPLGYPSLSMPTGIQVCEYQEQGQRCKCKEGRKPSVTLSAFWIM